MNGTRAQSKSFWSDQNRSFGLVMASGLSAIALARFVLAGEIAWWLIGAVTVFGVAALVAPALLHLLRIYWMKFAAMLGLVNSRILLTILFAGLITPMAMLMKLTNRLPLDLGFRDGTTSYWRMRKVDEFTPQRMERQF
ncbi:MAG: hypothetical protein FJX62_24510 [Alphaproteobacteria bacterium]|nr:hypothetical protein [Alphaproteobacteria bacterium]